MKVRSYRDFIRLSQRFLTFDLVNLLLHVIILVKKRWELASLGKAGAKDTRNLFDEGSRGEEVVVLLGELLDQLLVLVELLQVINCHFIDAKLVSFLTMLLVAKNADCGVGLWDDRKFERS